ncbi:MAG: hypothetical protein AMK72_08635 [Planctomycetes bacterium SM23_25]|nr:MAG: hypothetical protein AMK72_08635 [Planctomycetes bacterium SM23_25]
MRGVDKGRRELRVIQGALYAHFPQKVIKPLWAEIEKVLIMSADPLQADCRHVDKVVESACNLIPDMIRKYC